MNEKQVLHHLKEKAQTRASFAEAAQEIGITRSHLSMILKGTRRLNAKTLRWLGLGVCYEKLAKRNS